MPNNFVKLKQHQMEITIANIKFSVMTELVTWPRPKTRLNALQKWTYINSKIINVDRKIDVRYVEMAVYS